MTVFVDHPDRVFQLWGYTVSMGRLLLRSTKSEEFETRIDVLFQNVVAIQLPTVMHGLVVAQAGDEEVRSVVTATAILPDDDHHFYSLISSSLAGYVVAGVVVSDEDQGEYFEPSKLWPSKLSNGQAS